MTVSMLIIRKNAKDLKQDIITEKKFNCVYELLITDNRLNIPIS